jgi:hypothetical protein
LQFQVRKRGGRAPQVEPEFTQVGDDRIIGSTWWLDDGGRRIERYQVITFRDGKITDCRAARRDATQSGSHAGTNRRGSRQRMALAFEA